MNETSISGWLLKPGEIPRYIKAGTKYSVRRVLDPCGRRLSKRWALYRGEHRVWELQAEMDAFSAMRQADDWLKEYQ